jgi:hypothetical protein
MQVSVVEKADDRRLLAWRKSMAIADGTRDVATDREMKARMFGLQGCKYSK